MSTNPKTVEESPTGCGPLYRQFEIPQNVEPEIQLMSVISEAFASLLPSDSTFNMMAQLRVADWVHQRYGIGKRDQP